MTQEDYILREIEKIGQMLQGMLARFPRAERTIRLQSLDKALRKPLKS